MILGVTLASSIGGAVMPYKPGPLVILKAYSMAADVPVDFFKYICFSLPVTLLIMLFYVLVCKFVFRPNMGLLKDISVDFADADALVLTKKQKAAIIFFGHVYFYDDCAQHFTGYFSAGRHDQQIRQCRLCVCSADFVIVGKSRRQCNVKF